METIPIDISDIIDKAKQERRKFLEVEAKRKELEGKIHDLQQELKNLPSSDSWFVPQWRIELEQRIDAAIREQDNPLITAQ